MTNEKEKKLFASDSRCTVYRTFRKLDKCLCFFFPNCKTQSPDKLYSADTTTIIATQTKPMPEINICALTKSSVISINPASAGMDFTK